MTTILLVDDQALIRAAVAELVSHEPGFEVIGEATNGQEAVTLTTRLQPDIVLMDLRMPVMDGIRATELICHSSASAHTRVIVLTTFENDENVLSALRAGASGFIGKGAEATELIHAIRVVQQGDALLSPHATQALISRYTAAHVTDHGLLAPLTERERQILVEVGRGNSNDAIAARLFLSTHTVKTHVNRVMAKLSAHDRAQLVIVAYETGLITPGAP